MSVYKEPEAWIRSSVDSILRQTVSDFEFIIINDNPARLENDALLLEYQKKDDRIRIIRNAENLGLTKSLNIGLQVAQGEYIARMDADDFSFPDRFAVQLRYMQEHPDCIACSGLAYLWDGRTVTGKMSRPIAYPEILYYSFTSSPFVHPLLMMRRKSLESFGLRYNEDFRYSQDYKLAADMLKVGTIGNVDRYLLKYRISAQQITSKFGREQTDLTTRIRRELIDWYYAKFALPALPSVVSADALRENYRYEKTVCRSDGFSDDRKREFRIAMNCIRRLLYYSLSKYSGSSLWLFLRSGDYLRIPYKLRRFVIIVLKHFNATIVPRLL
ncbi:MAG: glycosyltransferase [Alistipes sp.]|nr:glycosyltransferase [Alistipes senegalensis]MCM1249564.1 glycosyltransferase [Alistipes sp.]